MITIFPLELAKLLPVSILSAFTRALNNESAFCCAVPVGPFTKTLGSVPSGFLAGLSTPARIFPFFPTLTFPPFRVTFPLARTFPSI